jgi:DNA mismatch repair ATPase MutL
LDQHALAERVIYEKLLKNDYGHNRQFLLISENINLLPKQIDIVKENIDLFNKM